MASSCAPAAPTSSSKPPPVAVAALPTSSAQSETPTLQSAAPKRICFAGGWCWLNPLPQGNHLRSVWAYSAEHAYAVGGEGTILRYDGVRWRREESNSTEDLTGVWGSGPRDVYAVGGAGLILHYDGKRWRRQESGFTDPLESVWGSAPDDVFVVGWHRTVAHFDGERWTQQSMPRQASLPPGAFPDDTLVSVWGSSGRDVYAATSHGRLLRYDGVSWSRDPSLSAKYINQVWGRGPNDVLVAGDELHHYDGSAWHTTKAPARTIRAVTGNGQGDVYGVAPSGKIFHYDGTTWRAETLLPDERQLLAITTSPTGEMFVVGEEGAIMRRDDGGWHLPPNTFTGSFSGVWGIGKNVAYLVASRGVLLYDNGKLKRVYSQGHGTAFTGIWADALDNVFVSGNGVVVHFDGKRWSTSLRATAQVWLSGIWGSGKGDVFAVGKRGTIYRYDGNTWTKEASGTQWADFTGVWGSGPKDVFVVGHEGRIFHYDGTQWQKQRSGGSEELTAVWGTASDDVYAVGRYGSVLRYDGTSWSEMHKTKTSPLWAISGTGRDDIYVSSSEAISHFDGKRWRRYETPSSGVRAIWSFGKRRAIAAGWHGLVLERR